MRIAYDARSLSQGGTGDTTYFSELISTLARENPQDEYLLYAPKPDPMREALAAAFANIHTHILPYKWFWNQKVLVPCLEQQGIKLLHTQYLLPWRFRGAFIVTIHDVSFHDHPQWYRTKTRLKMQLVITRSARRADVVLTGSEHARQAIARTCQVPLHKITVIPYAAGAWARQVDAEAHKDILQKYSLESPFLLGVGLRGTRKNSKVVIQALDMLHSRGGGPPLKLALCGSPEQFTAEVAASPNVQFLGWVPQEDLPPLYALAAAAVYPSVYEGFGLPVLEAMACGCPMLCSNATSLPEVAGDAALQRDPHDVDGWAAAIEQILLDETLRQKMIADGLKHAGTFSWEKTARETLEVYNKMLLD